jgi:tripartite-type tricarboxylate transporter receptor subunit TctC
MNVRTISIALALCAAAASAVAADWPARPIHLIVPYPAGGGTDIVSRLVGPKLSEAFKQPVVVENKLGAGGAIAVDYVAKSPADGYTVLFDSLSIVINPIISKVPYDPLKDLQPVAQLVSQAFIVVSNPKLAVKNLRDVVKLSNERPNGLNAATPGAATRLAAELFKLTTDAKMTFIPYKGGGPATLSVMSGETDLGFMDVPSVAQNVLGGRLTGLAVTTPKRLSLLPDVPTSAEAGLPEYKVDSWLGVFVPAGTPADIVSRLNREINVALASPDIVARIAQLGAEPSKSTVAEFTRLYRGDIEKWKDVVVRGKVKVE